MRILTFTDQSAAAGFPLFANCGNEGRAMRDDFSHFIKCERRGERGKSHSPLYPRIYINAGVGGAGLNFRDSWSVMMNGSVGEFKASHFFKKVRSGCRVSFGAHGRIDAPCFFGRPMRLLSDRNSLG